MSARARFPILEHTTYVNACSQGALSTDVRAAYEDYLRDWDELGAPWEYWVERSEAAREAFARFVGAQADEVAVQTSVSAAVSGIVSALDLAGRRIVISELEFPTVGQIAHAQELRGAEVVHVGPHAEEFEAAIDERTALVCCTSISYRTGTRLDTAAVARTAREQGALCLVDAYQAAGAVPLDVEEIGCDFLVTGTVKYLGASAGLAFLYVRRDLHDRLLPTQTGWFADRNIFEMQIDAYRPHESARRFDAGTPPIPNIYAGLAGIELIEQAGVAEIEEHARGLTERLLAGVEELGATVVTPPDARGPLTCIRSTDAPAIVRAMAADGIVTSERDSSVRVSPHLYNIEDDIDRVLDALRSNRALLA